MGFGNGRRGMKSPPLLIAVLLACVFVLGINYWLTSSRCAELQSRVFELEGRMRRAAAERGAVELKKNEFEEKLAKQREQIDNIHSLHSSKLQRISALCLSEKEALTNNITLKEKRIQTLEGHIKDLETNLAVLQENQNKRSSFELVQCRNKMNEQIEQCEERLRRATGKSPSLNPGKSDPLKQIILEKDDDKKEKQEIEDNEIYDIDKPLHDKKKALASKNEDKGQLGEIKDIPGKEIVPVPDLLHIDVDKLKDTQVQNKVADAPVQNKEKMAEDAALQKLKEKDIQKAENEDNGVIKKDAKVEELSKEGADKEVENEEVEREHLLNPDDRSEVIEAPKQPGKQNVDEERQNDYNGDEGNEAEPEGDKQAQLEDDQHLKEPNAMLADKLDQDTEQ